MANRAPVRKFLRQYILYPLQAGLVLSLFKIIRALPLNTASAMGGLVGRTVGPFLPVTRSARKNLKAAFPEKSADEIDIIISGMWDNLGRTAFEYPHLDRLKFYQDGADVEVVGVENIELLRDDGKPGIFFAGHLANWEIAALSAIHRGLPIHLIYRAPNNPFVERLFHHRQPGDGEMLPKGAQGARRAVALLRGGGHLGMLIDQKMNDGIAVPFFGRDAMTAPALAQFALKYGCPVVPAQAVRLKGKGAKFRLTLYPPMELPRTGDKDADIAAIMAMVNGHLEKWIRENPEQWLWVHKRWPE